MSKISIQVSENTATTVTEQNLDRILGGIEKAKSLLGEKKFAEVIKYLKGLLNLLNESSDIVKGLEEASKPEKK